MEIRTITNSPPAKGEGVENNAAAGNVTTTQIWGHRGACGHAPENTLTAFQLAVDMGADGVELDVQMSKDGELVVTHDETIERVSDGSGFVQDFTLAQLKRFNFNKRKITPPLFIEIPTLAEVFTLLKDTDLTINVELKTGIRFYRGIEEKVLTLANNFNISQRIIYSSFNHYSVMRVKELDPASKTAFLCGGGILTTAAECEAVGIDGLHMDLRGFRYPGLLEDCRRRGIALRLWTVNEEADLAIAFAAGVDAVVTNFPDRASRVKKD